MTTSAPLLVADIGGTNARFALATGSATGAGWQISAARTLSVADHPDIGEAVTSYLDGLTGERPAAACLAVAGPIIDDVVDFTNSPWTVRAADIAALMGSPVRLVNDFAAMARGAVALGAGETEVLIAGEAEPGRPVAVIGPGTGLGQALLVPRGSGGFTVVATEGGHTAFAPQDPEEAEILAYLGGVFGYVSFERVASGQGIENLWQGVAAVRGLGLSPARAADIHAAAEAGDGLAAHVLGLFAAVTGTFAGNAVLAAGARGGLYVGGGIIPRLGSLFDRERFASRFAARGPMSPFLQGVPVWLITAGHTALLGAAALWADEQA
jgi:glucokinase